MLIFCDFEVFKYDWLVVLINPHTQEKKAIINDKVALQKYYEDNKDNVFVGYNIRHYDVYIFRSILLGLNPYDMSQHIINGGKGWEFVPGICNIPLKIFDIKTTSHSLKELEAFMGNDIQESSVPFDIDRKLTEEETNETIKYCLHDVEQAMLVFAHRKFEFDSQLSLLKAFNLDLKYISKTKPQIVAVILEAHKKDRNDEFNLEIVDTLILMNEEYQSIYEWYLKPENHKYKDENDNKLQQQILVSNVPHIFGWGGIHGAIENYVDDGLFVNMDVSSFYPAIMIEYGFLSRNVKTAEKYREIRDTRIKLKAEKNKMQEAYKIVLNSTSGASKYEYNDLYDPRQANNICVNGQLLLLDLIEKLEPHWKLIQSNTDGIMGKVKNKDDISKIKKIASEWEKRTRMNLEYEIYTKVIQKDVNNYILVKEDGTYKSIGTYVKKLNPIDNDLPIVNLAIINYYLKQINPEVTINFCDDLIMFQKVNKVTYKFDYATHGEIKLKEKCLRTFASKRPDDQGVYKYKDGSQHKIENTPEKCFIDNSNIIGKKVPDYLDKQWYIDTAWERINSFKGGN